MLHVYLFLYSCMSCSAYSPVCLCVSCLYTHLPVRHVRYAAFQHFHHHFSSERWSEVYCVSLSHCLFHQIRAMPMSFIQSLPLTLPRPSPYRGHVHLLHTFHYRRHTHLLYLLMLLDFIKSEKLCIHVVYELCDCFVDSGCYYCERRTVPRHR